jgi:transposase-like protein
VGALRRSIPADQQSCVIEKPARAFSDRVVRISGHYAVLTENEALELSIPRDRRGSFEPQLIAKYERRFPGFDDKIISMYARGMSAREIQGHLRDSRRLRYPSTLHCIHVPTDDGTS